jgi:hypothetical protein
MNQIKSFFVQAFTEPNNHTICPVRIIGVAAVLQGLGLSAYAVVVQHATFDLLAYGGGIGALLGALGAALGMKKDTPHGSA